MDLRLCATHGKNCLMCSECVNEGLDAALDQRNKDIAEMVDGMLSRSRGAKPYALYDELVEAILNFGKETVNESTKIDT